MIYMIVVLVLVASALSPIFFPLVPINISVCLSIGALLLGMHQVHRGNKKVNLMALWVDLPEKNVSGIYIEVLNSGYPPVCFKTFEHVGGGMVIFSPDKDNILIKIRRTFAQLIRCYRDKQREEEVIDVVKSNPVPFPYGAPPFTCMTSGQIYSYFVKFDNEDVRKTWGGFFSGDKPPYIEDTTGKRFYFPKTYARLIKKNFLKHQSDIDSQCV